MLSFLRELRAVDYSLRMAKVLTGVVGFLAILNMLVVAATVLTGNWVLSAAACGQLAISATMYRYAQMKRGRAERNEWIRNMEAVWGS